MLNVYQQESFSFNCYTSTWHDEATNETLLYQRSSNMVLSFRSQLKELFDD